MTAKTHLVNKSELRIIPAIDIINGKCVRLTKGDYTTQKIYRDNPLDVAKEFEDNGIKYLHLVDLDGAKSKHIVNYHILNEIATKTSLSVDFGGGIKSDDDIRIAFDNGAVQVTVGALQPKTRNGFFIGSTCTGAIKSFLAPIVFIEKSPRKDGRNNRKPM